MSADLLRQVAGTVTLQVLRWHLAQERSLAPPSQWPGMDVFLDGKAAACVRFLLQEARKAKEGEGPTK